MSTRETPGSATSQPTLEASTGPRRSSTGRRIALVGAVAVAAVLLLLVGGALWFHGRLQASLPTLEGEVSLAGLSAPVTVERDDLGVPTVTGETRLDVARATGFLHAQDRFFQMDLLRRQAAGELSELFGETALPMDRSVRLHGFRGIARRVVAAASSDERALLEAYAAGVNQGLGALTAPSFEYTILNADPAPWLPEDSALVVLAMVLALQDADGTTESALGVMADTLPAALVDFLAPRGTEWDAPVEGEPFVAPPIPGPEVLDLRGTAPLSLGSAAELAEAEPGTFSGSNNWAVAGARTAHGGAILASDMHLGISVPNTWYRMVLTWPDPADSARRHVVEGVTLPGAPTVIVGSNTRIAWAFTNSYGDWSDLVILDEDPAIPNTYMTPQGPLPFQHRTETIAVKGGPAVEMEVVSTIWGPVIDRDHRGRQRAYRWVAHDERGTNFKLGLLETAATLNEAQEIAASCGIPAQNLVCADAAGSVGWTIIGAIPRRVGFDGRTPTSWASGDHRWDGWLSPDEYPRIVDPPGGRIWTANARVVSDEKAAIVGDGGYALGARAGQIRDALLAVDSVRERDMLAIQLDDRALFLDRWRDLLQELLTPAALADAPGREELRRLIAESWDGHASVGSVGYRIVRTFRLLAAKEAFESLTAECKKADERFDYRFLSQTEGPLWRLVSERPPHLVSPTRASWEEQLMASVDATVAELTGDGTPLSESTWGKRNTLKVQHPLSRAVPFLSPWLDMPRQELPGDSNMPRVQGVTFGASERMVVSPGREEQGFFHMPCGQSGHPSSPYYRAGHQAWARGEPTPFLPGPTVHTLRLVPPATDSR